MAGIMEELEGPDLDITSDKIITYKSAPEILINCKKKLEY